MAISHASRWIYAVSFALVGTGFLLPLWPVVLAGIALAALSGRWISGLAMALLVDVAWGAPMGLAQYLFFPFTITALLLSAGRLWGSSYFYDRSTLDTL
ncbi:hypothetical protein IT396_02410 [Candidatus Nomurabacteria bacterium]|nr:hypothetical protein [Candidatus Nomurabacteria bacterium]